MLTNSFFVFFVFVFLFTFQIKKSDILLTFTHACFHINFCINAYETLCSDNKCKINKQVQIKEDKIRIELNRQFIDEYKKSLGINSFLDLNKKLVDKKI